MEVESKIVVTRGWWWRRESYCLTGLEFKI
jgi:hypothetical protein